MLVILLYYMTCVVSLVRFVFFFKQKTAYEMRISDWSSDVCSSDLGARGRDQHRIALRRIGGGAPERLHRRIAVGRCAGAKASAQIGRASCRERVCQYV